MSAVCSRCGENVRSEPGTEVSCGGGSAIAITREEFENGVECDCCGKRVPSDQVALVLADQAGAAGCDTTACEACRSPA